MINPEYYEIEKLAAQYDKIPVSREIYADAITPITLLRKIASKEEQYYLLESIEGGERWGRYSFLGYQPVMRVTAKDNIVRIEGEEKKEIKTDKPLSVLRDILSRCRSPKRKELPPFTGGFVGYFAYSMIKYAEPVLKLESGKLPDMDVMLFDKVIAYDHLKQKIIVIVNMRTDELEKNYQKALNEMKNMVTFIQSEILITKQHSQAEVVFHSEVSSEEYEGMVEKTKEYIRNGDIFQAVISRKFEAEYHDDLINAYRVLRTTNPSPYMVYLKTREAEIISTSPETLVRLKDKKLYTFPVAGSRPRGKNEEEDKLFEQELLQDEKELSEHNMLVDLARNDIGRISRFHSVNVTEYKMIHKYSKIMHITSMVEGLIKEDKDACDTIEAVLPAGTLSGAPKIRACEIIEEIEKGPRNIYGGALGYLDFTGNMDTCIAIRMAVKKDGKVCVQAGGGIVADSIPIKEYEESENKAKAVMEAIMKASEVDET